MKIVFELIGYTAPPWKSTISFSSSSKAEIVEDWYES